MKTMKGALLINININYSQNAYEVTLAYLKLFQGKPEKELTDNNVQEEAKRLVFLAIKASNVINISDILNLDAVKLLQAKNKDAFDFLNLFTSGDVKAF